MRLLRVAATVLAVIAVTGYRAGSVAHADHTDVGDSLSQVVAHTGSDASATNPICTGNSEPTTKTPVVPEQGYGQHERETDEERQDDEVARNRQKLRDLPPGASKSGYQEEDQVSGPTGVEADLAANDERKRPVLEWLGQVAQPLYDFKDRINGTWGLRFSVDYNFLNQYASFSFTEDHATSGNLRFYGTWNPLQVKQKYGGNLVYRIENRHSISGRITPRDMGFDTGSALSTASFKDFDWGVTSLYWRQFFLERRLGFVFGQMDPGDFMDAFPLLSAWTAFMNDAFFNNPGEALPQQGVGFVGRVYVSDHYYIAGGVHDALADADGVDVAELFDGTDLFRWFEFGWSPNKKASPGDSIHLTVWQQDALPSKETTKSQGIAASFAPNIFGRHRPFVRVGFSNGNAAMMRHIIAVGTGIKLRDNSDLFGVATSWGAPVEEGTDNQWTSEIFYRIQLTEHLQVTPDIQVIFNPSFNDEKDAIWLASVLRMRLAF